MMNFYKHGPVTLQINGEDAITLHRDVLSTIDASFVHALLADLVRNSAEPYPETVVLSVKED